MVFFSWSCHVSTFFISSLTRFFTNWSSLLFLVSAIDLRWLLYLWWADFTLTIILFEISILRGWSLTKRLAVMDFLFEFCSSSVPLHWNLSQLTFCPWLSVKNILTGDASSLYLFRLHFLEKKSFKLSFSRLNSRKMSWWTIYSPTKSVNRFIALSEKTDETYLKLIKRDNKHLYFFSASLVDIIINAIGLRTWELRTIIEPWGLCSLNFSTNHTWKLVQSLQYQCWLLYLYFVMKLVLFQLRSPVWCFFP